MAGSTTQRGYGWEHQKARAKALKALTPGTLCHHCGEPMWKDQELDLDHVVPLAHGGRGPRRLAHASCNRRAGQAIGQARRASTPNVFNSRAW